MYFPMLKVDSVVPYSDIRLKTNGFRGGFCRFSSWGAPEGDFSSTFIDDVGVQFGICPNFGLSSRVRKSDILPPLTPHNANTPPKNDPQF
ncbi:unnamed protein product [Tenebrio molitor]|nr:unnamed protein product [Tenebrio molitor]